MRERFKLWLWQWLIALDQFAGVGCTFWTYVLLGRGKPPNADETISSRVGRAAVAGKRWGLVAERIINRLARWVGDAPDHCRRCIGS
jgi:hypothetical protein